MLNVSGQMARDLDVRCVALEFWAVWPGRLLISICAGSAGKLPVGLVKMDLSEAGIWAVPPLARGSASTLTELTLRFQPREHASGCSTRHSQLPACSGAALPRHCSCNSMSGAEAAQLP